jgi:hypothetical protein
MTEPSTPELLRTSRHGCWQLKRNAWGQFLAPVDDPLANVVLNDEQLKGFELNERISPIPADLWSRWIKLCFHFAKERQGNLEVSCRLLRREDDKSQWRIAVPPQAVGGASVHAEDFDGSIDITTGEVIEQWPPDGWIPCGSSHSHNTMAAFFSGTDDKYELGDPGLHIVVGSISLAANNYTYKASIAANGRRFIIPLPLVADLTPTASDFHPDVLRVVELERPLWPTTAFAQYSQRWSRSAGFTDPNAGNGYYRRPSSTALSGRLDDDWDEQLDDYGTTTYPRYSSARFGRNIDTADIEEAVNWLIRDAIDTESEKDLLAALRHLQDTIEAQVEQLVEMDALINEDLLASPLQ